MPVLSRIWKREKNSSCDTVNLEIEIKNCNFTTYYHPGRSYNILIYSVFFCRLSVELANKSACREATEKDRANLAKNVETLKTKNRKLTTQREAEKARAEVKMCIWLCIRFGIIFAK